MLTEQSILNDIHENISAALLKVCEIKKDIETKNALNNIKNNVKNLDNNYFFQDKDDIYDKFLDFFGKDGMLFKIIKILNNYKDNIEDKLTNICQHDWIHDEIDICPERTQIITYCKKCEITKN
jgi:hypothetical protein